MIGIPRTRGWGLALALVTACISGTAIFVNAELVGQVGDATVYTTAKNGVAALVLLVALGLVRAGRVRRDPTAGSRPTGRQWLGLVALGAVGGSVPFVLFFEGLARAASPADAGFIHKTLVVWVTIGAVVFLRERIGPWHIAALALLIGGQAALGGGVGALVMGRGELLILAATLLWAGETVVAKRVLGDVAPQALAVARMGGGAMILVAHGVVTGGLTSIGAVQLHHLGWILLTSVTLAAYVGTWYAALSRAQAVDVSAVLVGGALITALLDSGVRGLAAPPPLGVVLVMAGVAAILVGRVRSASPG